MKKLGIGYWGLTFWFIVWMCAGGIISCLLGRDPGGMLATPQESHTEPLISAAAESGQIHGSIQIESKIPSISMAVSIYSRRVGSSPSEGKMPEHSEWENVVIYLERNSISPPSAHPPKEDRISVETERSSGPAQHNPSMQQIHETFVPHVLPIRAGTSVDFPNGDPFFHNVFSLSGPKSFDLGRYPQGHKRTVRFDKPGIIKVFCHIHSHMNAVVLVFDHPYFAVPDDKGHYIIPQVPAGNYTLVAWHERLKPVKRAVNIKPGETLTMDLIL
jgi:plastocyanin